MTSFPVLPVDISLMVFGLIISESVSNSFKDESDTLPANIPHLVAKYQSDTYFICQLEELDDRWSFTNNIYDYEIVQIHVPKHNPEASNFSELVPCSAFVIKSPLEFVTLAIQLDSTVLNYSYGGYIGLDTDQALTSINNRLGELTTKLSSSSAVINDSLNGHGGSTYKDGDKVKINGFEDIHKVLASTSVMITNNVSGFIYHLENEEDNTQMIALSQSLTFAETA